MTPTLIKYTKSFLRLFDIEITRSSTLVKGQAKLRAACRQAKHDVAFLQEVPPETLREVLRSLPYSKAQKRQDLFALSELCFKRNGYFVEIGATNGVSLSNTHLLEKQFGWTGILVEPARCWHEALKANREAHIETRCVWKTSHETVEFREVENPVLSGIREYWNNDAHAANRQRGTHYPVQTVSLNDLLEICNAPQEIDYLSVDTEGSELDILSSFDFSRRRIRVITVEHNFTPARDGIHRLLSKNGYTRRLESVSAFDDWYVETV